MSRSLLSHTVADSAGNVIQNALCNIYVTGTTTPVSDLYTAASGGSPVTTLTSNAQGEVTGWLTSPKLVDVEVTDNTETAYYPSRSTAPLTWTPFTETVAVVSVDSGASGPDVPTVQYLEWNWDDDPLDQSVVFPAGTLLTFAIITVHEEFAFPSLSDATFSLGTLADPTALVNGATPQAVDVLITNTDFGGGTDPAGFTYGMPFSADTLTFFEAETTVVGTLDPGTATSGRLRFFFAACIPSAA